MENQNRNQQNNNQNNQRNNNEEKGFMDTLQQLGNNIMDAVTGDDQDNQNNQRNRQNQNR